MAQDSVTVTLRLIRSFEHRNIKHLVLNDVKLDMTCADLMVLAKEKISTATSLPPPFKKFDFDCMKIEYQAHGAKTNDPVINHDDDDKLILDAEKTLLASGVKHETEISCFKREEYDKYKANPILVW